MGTSITGIVEAISQKAIANGGSVYNFKVNNAWYGHGFVAPAFNKGDNISFEYSANGKFNNADVSTIAVLAEAPAASPAAAAQPAAGSNAWDDRQNSILYQSSRKDALTLVGLGLQYGELSLGSKKADKLVVLEATVDKYTEQFFADAKNMGKTSAVVNQATVAGDE